jgi:hypothetical protein
MTNDVDADEPYERRITVLLSCNGQRVNEQDVEFLGIAEDIQGRDVLTFTCPICCEIHRSLRFG